MEGSLAAVTHARVRGVPLYGVNPGYATPLREAGLTASGFGDDGAIRVRGTSVEGETLVFRLDDQYTLYGRSRPPPARQVLTLLLNSTPLNGEFGVLGHTGTGTFHDWCTRHTQEMQ
jgi:hypothetical protein